MRALAMLRKRWLMPMLLRLWAGFWACALAIAPIKAAAADDEGGWRLQGALRANAFSSDRLLTDRRGAGSLALQLDASRDYGSAGKAKLDAALFHQLDASGERTCWRPRDVSWTVTRGDVDATVGWLPLNFGKADVLNPSDFFVVHDFTVLQPSEADQRNARPAGQLDVRTGVEGIVSLIVAPRIEPDRLPQHMMLSMLASTRHTAAPVDIAARVERSDREIDWSLIAFHGATRNPVLLLEDGQVVRGQADVVGLGGDAAWNVGACVLKIEAAYNWLKRGKGAQQNGAPRDNFYAVFGVEKNWGHLNGGLQLSYRRTSHWRPPTEQDDVRAFIETANSVMFGQVRRDQGGGTARLSYVNPSSRLDLELFAIAYLNPSCTYSRGQLGYMLDTRQRLQLGLEHYQGDQACVFGQLQRNDAAFFEYKIFF